MTERKEEPVRYAVFWWYQSKPCYAIIDDDVTAAVAANVRNALIIEFRGEIIKVLDWYRRDDAGNPMPAELRDLVPTRAPFMIGGML